METGISLLAERPCSNVIVSPDTGCGRRYYITMIVFEATQVLLHFWFPYSYHHTMANVIKNPTGLHPMMQHVRSHSAAATCICVESVLHFLLRRCGQWCSRCSILDGHNDHAHPDLQGPYSVLDVLQDYLV